MVTEARLITAEELERMPQADGRVELVRGELVGMAPAGHRHGRITGRLHGRLDAFVVKAGLGWVYSSDTGFVLARNPDTVRAPDIAYVARERAMAQAGEEGFFEGPPDLAVEVVSPSDTLVDIETKVIEYLRAGTRLVWVVNSRTRTVTVYRSLKNVRILTEAETLAGEEVLPGFATTVGELFE
ncbi:MAG: Uma2 family endonuclease [Chloroflexi bacterium]|nr:Uma2 family endonuclease [Chloroflexota bacterium]